MLARLSVCGSPMVVRGSKLKNQHPDTCTTYSCIVDDGVQKFDAEVGVGPREDNAQ